MAATKLALASGGITHCRLRWGLRTFFLKSFRSCCRWPSRRCSIRRPSPRAGANSNARTPRAPASRSERSISPPPPRRKSAAPQVFYQRRDCQHQGDEGQQPDKASAPHHRAAVHSIPIIHLLLIRLSELRGRRYFASMSDWIQEITSSLESHIDHRLGQASWCERASRRSSRRARSRGCTRRRNRDRRPLLYESNLRLGGRRDRGHAALGWAIAMADSARGHRVRLLWNLHRDRELAQRQSRVV